MVTTRSGKVSTPPGENVDQGTSEMRTRKSIRRNSSASIASPSSTPSTEPEHLHASTENDVTPAKTPEASCNGESNHEIKDTKGLPDNHLFPPARLSFSEALDMPAARTPPDRSLPNTPTRPTSPLSTPSKSPTGNAEFSHPLSPCNAPVMHIQPEPPSTPQQPAEQACFKDQCIAKHPVACLIRQRVCNNLWPLLTLCVACLIILLPTLLRTLQTYQSDKYLQAASTARLPDALLQPLQSMLTAHDTWSDAIIDLWHASLNSHKAACVMLLADSPATCTAAAQQLLSSLPRPCVLHLNGSSFTSTNPDAAGALQSALSLFAASCPAGTVVLTEPLALSAAALPVLVNSLSEHGALQRDGRAVATNKLRMLLFLWHAQTGVGSKSREQYEQAWRQWLRAALSGEDGGSEDVLRSIHALSRRIDLVAPLRSE